MLLGIHDDSVLAQFERNETEHPCPRKELDDRTIYLSRPMPLTKGEPSITDLSEARFGDQTHTDRIMPNVYRAPEVILGHPWGYPVDVWGFGMVVSLVSMQLRFGAVRKGRVDEDGVHDSFGISSSRSLYSIPGILKIGIPKLIILPKW